MGGKVYGLLGRTLGHSWSVPIHQALGCAEYRLIELEPAELPAFLRREDLGGVNVTIPYKREVMALCDEIDPVARDIGSVNTLVRRKGKLCAFNTDAVGFRFLAERAGISLAGKKVVILGSGGASLTAQAVARAAGARQVVVLSRSGPETYESIPRHADAQVVVNATPVGMFPHAGETPVDLRAFPACEGVLDMVYNPRRTALLLQAEALGIPCSDGLPMLVAQAVAAEEHFLEAPIPAAETERILALLRRETGNIVLVGMPGSGKTTVGRALAALTGREAVDVDAEIVARTGRSIPEIFAAEGEAAFRALERAETARIGARTGILLLTGGGVVKDERNDAALRQNGRVYHLLRSPAALATRGRPLSQGADLEALWAERAPLYRRVRDVEIDNNGTPAAAAAEIWRDFCAHCGDKRPQHESAGSAPAGDLRP